MQPCKQITINSFSVKHSLEFSPQGFAISKDELFSVFAYTPCVRVYHIEPFSFLRTIPVEGMKNPWHIVASENVLYVSENCDELIHRNQLPDETVSNWTVEGSLLTLSIAKNGDVIVASCDPAKIFEYTSGGTLVRKIAVNQHDSNLISLQHALRLDVDKFLVCHTKKTHNRVCIIDSTGVVIKCYGESKGSGKGQLNLPLHLAIGRNGSILVADCDNNRIVQLNASLEYIKEFVGFKRPWRLLLKEELGRLYVIEWNERSIKILDM